MTLGKAPRIAYGEELLALATNEHLRSGDLEPTYRAIAEAGCRVTGVPRTSIWLLDGSAEVFRCCELYDARINSHLTLPPIELEKCPSFVQALLTGRAIASADASDDPRTAELRDVLLAPGGVTSVLLAPVRVSGNLVGVICHKQVGVRREWTQDEVAFAAGLADQTAHALLNAERRSEGVGMGRKLSVSVDTWESPLPIYADGKGQPKDFRRVCGRDGMAVFAG